MPSALNLTCPPLPRVRIALIGVGGRGIKTLERYAYIKDATICCVVDVDAERLALANRKLQESGRPAARALCGENAWAEACRASDVDLVYICTGWSLHARIAVEAMRCGKHVAVEVPAACTVEECRLLVRTAEETQRHLFMTENCCYDFYALETLEMQRLGLFGEITHCEGAYIHDLSQYGDAPAVADDRIGWMRRECARHEGNAYPTHAIGPIAQLLDFHSSDRMVRLTSLTSRSSLPGGGEKTQVSNTLIQTLRGRTILLQLDVTTPRPYSRLQTICGTKAFAQKYPVVTLQTGHNAPLMGEEAQSELQNYATSHAAQLWVEGHELCVPNEMNYAMDMRLIYCLRKGLPLDIDVYDAAEWSCLSELTRLSAQGGGVPVDVPQFRP